MRAARADPYTRLHGHAVLVLAFGIGVNATVFTLANALFLRPLR